MAVLITGLLLIISVFMGLYIWMKHCHSYWQRMGVPFIKPNIIFGNFKQMLTMSCNPAEQFYSLYFNEKTKDEPIVGVYVMDRPGLIVRDLNIVKWILIRDFNKFCDRSTTPDRHTDIIGSYNLTTAKNPEWKQLRAVVSPLFTSVKLKGMVSRINEVGIALDKYCCNLPFDPKTNSCIAEVREISAHFTTDVISSVAYGVQANSLTNPNADFRSKGREVMNYNVWRVIEVYSVFFFPQLVRILRIKAFGKVTTNFLRTTLNFIIQQRIKSEERHNDLIDALIAFKKSIEADNEAGKILSHSDVLIAQGAIFFAAGFNAPASAISFTLYELAKNPEVQKRLRQEIKEALLKYDGKVTYDMLNEMEYMEMVINEVLRLYPSTSFLDRECVLTENDEPYSLAPYSDFKIPHKTPIYIPIFSIHRDPKYYPNPEKFDPERFSPKNKENLIPMSFLAFGLGPRGCIGQRLGYIQTKIGLIYFLRNHYVTTCEKYHHKMVFDPKALTTSSKGGIFCKIVKDPLIEA